MVQASCRLNVLIENDRGFAVAVAAAAALFTFFWRFCNSILLNVTESGRLKQLSTDPTGFYLKIGFFHHYNGCSNVGFFSHLYCSISGV